MVKKLYFDEHIEYLRKISPGRYNDEIAEIFNKKFGFNATAKAINRLKKRNGIVSNVPTGKRQYTQEQLDYLRELCEEGLFNDEITQRFNEKFNLNKTESAIQNIRCKYNIQTSARKYFEEGHIPWNKGKEKTWIGGEETRFKKGNTPHNYMPVGSERITSEGYVEIKIEDPDVWKVKHHIVWEEHHGKQVPEGHVVIFGDRDTKNFDIDNLICVSRAQLLVLNRHGLIQEDADLTRTGIIIADLNKAISDRRKK